MMAAVVHRIAPEHAADTLSLMADLRVSAFGICSPRLHAALVADALAGRTDARVAVEDGQIVGTVLAAPAWYWRTALLRHWGVAFECLGARLSSAPSGHDAASHHEVVDSIPTFHGGVPPRTWNAPGDAWRIIIVGTAARARRRGIGALLYRALMADRSLVARIAADNVQSLELHRSLGWRLYPDGRVVLAVYMREARVIPSPQPRIAV